MASGAWETCSEAVAHGFVRATVGAGGTSTVEGSGFGALSFFGGGLGQGC